MSEKAKDKTSDVKEFERLGKLVNNAKTVMKEQENKVIKMKQEKKPKKEIKKESKILKKKIEEVQKLTKQWRRADPNKLHLKKKDFEEFLIRRFFFIPSNDIYGGKKGFFDYGPAMCAIQYNLINAWRKHFIMEENMLEVDCSIVTPSKVFEVSGHLKRFFDYMVRDEVTQEFFRVDKLIEDASEEIFKDPKTPQEKVEELKKILQTLDDCNDKKFDEIIKKFGILSPKGNKLTPSFPFNLMFRTEIGPSGKDIGYLRPETAQGIFTNFKRLYDYNSTKLPFAAAQIGKSFRNEIAPKSSILRVREFIQAEIEHFMDPKDTEFSKYDDIKDIELVMFPRENQTSGESEEKMSIDTAVKRGIIKNKTLCYYLTRIYTFFIKIGMLPEGIRFRQHLSSEMSFYASDCWDAELLTTYGWYEIVGIADRACYDLNNHQTASNSDMFARRKLEKPIIKEVQKLEVNKKVFFKTFKADSSKIVKYLNSLEEEKKMEIKQKMEKEGQVKLKIEEKEFVFLKDYFTFKTEEIKISEEKFLPNVIEPSFGIGRMIYCLLEHSFWIREDPEGKNKLARSVLSFEPVMAPYKCCILTTRLDKEIEKIVKEVRNEVNDYDLSFMVDITGKQIGRKYAKMDEIGIPFAITVDSDSVKDKKVTIRERDSCTQVRLDISKVGQVISELCRNKMTWKECQEKYEEQKQVASEKVGKKE